MSNEPPTEETRLFTLSEDEVTLVQMTLGDE